VGIALPGAAVEVGNALVVVAVVVVVGNAWVVAAVVGRRSAS